jgi:hypothetical protein
MARQVHKGIAGDLERLRGCLEACIRPWSPSPLPFKVVLDDT